MSELIREVVQNILQNKTSAPEPERRGGVAETIERPNYQRQKAEDRLTQLRNARQPVGLVTHAGDQPGMAVGDVGATMRRMCLTHECERAPRILAQPADGLHSDCEIIGRVGPADGIWWFGAVDDRALTERVREVWDGSPAAVVMLRTTAPPQVLLLDALLHSLDSTARFRVGQRGADGSIMIGITNPNEQELKKQLKALATNLNRVHQAHKESFLLEYPCVFIQRLLDVQATPAMGILLNVQELEGVMIANWLYHKVPDVDITVTIKDNWLLLTGPVEDVHKGLDTAKWYRDRIRG